MQDRVPLYPGRVTLTPVSGQANTYDMVRADAPTQEGTPLNKATLLSDATAALLGGCSTPDGALRLLGRFHGGLGNEYVWLRRTISYTTEQGQTLTRLKIYTESNWDFSCRIRYANDIYVDADGRVQLADERTIVLTRSNFSSNKQLLNGKYFAIGSGINQRVYLGTSYLEIYADDFYGISIYACVPITVITVYTPDIYVNSPDPAAYPPAVSDGYDYQLLGPVGERVRVATGSYTGTGTYGITNPCELALPFRPQILIISAGINGPCGGTSKGWDTDCGFIWSSGQTRICIQIPSYSSSTEIVVEQQGDTISWHSPTSAQTQFNSTQKYRFLAIG